MASVSIKETHTREAQEKLSLSLRRCSRFFVIGFAMPFLSPAFAIGTSFRFHRQYHENVSNTCTTFLQTNSPLHTRQTLLKPAFILRCQPLTMTQETTPTKDLKSTPPPPSTKPDETAPKDLAEETRRALSASDPLVKFRRDTDYADRDHSDFAYTSGVKSGVDIWLITSILFFIVPFIVFFVYVQNGTIDLTPR